MIGILDMEMGNLGSVWNAIYESGFDPEVIAEPAALDDVDWLILPGVGNFATAMTNLEKSGMRSAILDYANSGRPLLGLCVGMQVLAANGTEGGDTTGLGLIDGTVTRLSSDKPIRIPHVGWNTVHFVRDHPVLEDIKPDRDFYFVHSYAFRPADDATAIATTDYGERFACIVADKNVIGCQFHPEKSQANGLRILENFCRWNGTC